MDECRNECLDDFFKNADDFLCYPIDDFIDEFVNDFLE